MISKVDDGASKSNDEIGLVEMSGTVPIVTLISLRYGVFASMEYVLPIGQIYTLDLIEFLYFECRAS
jgi:hypothetical protein